MIGVAVSDGWTPTLHLSGQTYLGDLISHPMADHQQKNKLISMVLQRIPAWGYKSDRANPLWVARNPSIAHGSRLVGPVVDASEI